MTATVSTTTVDVAGVSGVTGPEVKPDARWRLRYSKRHKLRFLGHRDVARVWERALRAAAIPVAMSAGFSPRPKMSFGLALPTGAESVAEYLDVTVTGEGLDDGEDLCSRVAPVLPPGLEVLAAAPIDAKAASLQEAVVASSWEFLVADTDAPTLNRAIERILESPEVMVTRERKGASHVDDIRPAILELSVIVGSSLAVDDPRPRVRATLGQIGRGIRPGELVSVLLPEADTAAALQRVLRTHQWIESDGARREPLPAAEASLDAEGGTTWTPPTRPPGPTAVRERLATVMTGT